MMTRLMLRHLLKDSLQTERLLKSCRFNKMKVKSIDITIMF